MSLTLLMLGYLSFFKNRTAVKFDYSLDTFEEKELISKAFSRYWPTDELYVLTLKDLEGIHADDLQGLTKAAIFNNDCDQVKSFFNKAVSAGVVGAAGSSVTSGASDSDFYKIVADFFYSQDDNNKFGVFRSEYLLALNKLLEFHIDDGKYFLGRADYFKKCEDYDAARADYNQLMDIYPDDLWLPYVISYTYRKQDMKDAANTYGKYIGKNFFKIQNKLNTHARLNTDMDSSDDFKRIKSLIDSNDQVGRLLKLVK